MAINGLMLFLLCLNPVDVSSLSFLFSHRSENSKSEVSIDEEIEEVSIEGPDISDKVSSSPSSKTCRYSLTKSLIIF